MNIWILQTGEPLPIDSIIQRPMRAMNLSKAFNDECHNVTIWSSNFDHYNKQFREQKFGTKVKILNSRTNLILINSTGYRKNISLMRLIDHLVLGLNLNRELNRVDPPDLAIIGYPPIETSWFMARWLSRRSVPYFLDVKDAWPHVIVEAFPKPIRQVLRFLLYPYFAMFKSTVRNSSQLCSISESFLKWSQSESNKKSEDDFVAYLTSKDSSHESNDFFQIKSDFHDKLMLDSKKLTIYFVGSLTRNFDFDPILAIAKKNKVNLIIAGDGPQFESLTASAENYENIYVIGRVNQLQAKAIAELSDIAIVPMKNLSDFRMSIPNKFFDYMLNEKPILSSLDGDSRNLIEQHKIGYYYANSEDLEKIIDSLNDSKDELIKVGKNGRKTYTEIFSYDKVYNFIVSRLENLAVKFDV